MARTEVFLPISRSEHLQALFNSLEHLACDPDETSLLAYVDGDSDLHKDVELLAGNTKFHKWHVYHRPQQASEPKREFNVGARRRRIAAIWNEAKALVGECEYVFCIEDDTIVPSHALETLLDDYSQHPHAGLIEGVELGRWGIAHVGAWLTNDVYEPTRLESLRRGTRIIKAELKGASVMRDNTIELDLANVEKEPVPFEDIDAGGFYCYLTKREHFVGHDYKPWNDGVLGPDVDFGLALRQQGYKNYIDWSVSCRHLTKGGRAISMANTPIVQFVISKQDGRWKQQIK